MADPGVTTPAVDHDPPSLPGSPLPKRSKQVDASPNVETPTTDATPAGNASNSADLAGLLADPAADTPSALPSMSSNNFPQALPSLGSASLDPLAAGSMPSLPSLASAVDSLPPPLTAGLGPIGALQVKKLSGDAHAPTRGSAYAAGYDVYASKGATVPKRGRVVVETDIAVAVPEGTYGRIAPRSGLAVKHGIDVGAGVIDADYRGPLKILLFNFAEEDFEIKAGDRIAQMVLEKIYTPEVLVVEELDESVRGAGGFGSTGGFGNLPLGPNGVPLV